MTGFGWKKELQNIINIIVRKLKSNIIFLWCLLLISMYYNQLFKTCSPQWFLSNWPLFNTSNCWTAVNLTDCNSHPWTLGANVQIFFYISIRKDSHEKIWASSQNWTLYQIFLSHYSEADSTLQSYAGCGTHLLDWTQTGDDRLLQLNQWRKKSAEAIRKAV